MKQIIIAILSLCLLIVSSCGTKASSSFVITVLRVNQDQIPAKAVRMHFPPDAANPQDRWSIYLAHDAGAEVLQWELEQIANGTTWDKI